MRQFILTFFIAAEIMAALMLAGCGFTFDYDALREAKPDGSGFTAALGREYKEFALVEADDMYDWPDAVHFGTKALDATAGKATEPERLADWRLPVAEVGALTAARSRLVSALDAGAADMWPDLTARAQARFDCWVEQQEENWQTEDIARCRDGFLAAVGSIEREIAVMEQTAREATPASAVDPGTPAMPDPIRFTFYFDFDSTTVGTEDGNAVAAIAKAAKQGRGVRILVDGFADRAGSAAYNAELSHRRAEALALSLIAQGVPADRITIGAHGEARPAVPTDDGVREPLNRRAEVTVGIATES